MSKEEKKNTFNRLFGTHKKGFSGDSANSQTNSNETKTEVDALSDDDDEEEIEKSMVIKSNRSEKSKKASSEVTIRGHHWFDMLFVIILFLSLVLELVSIVWYRADPESFKCEFIINILENTEINYYFKHYGSYINEVIMTLFPIFISILNISISVSNQDIYGLKLSAYRRLDKKAPYTILGMTILSFSMLFLSIILYCFKFFLSMIVLNIATFIYTIYFCYLIIPILARSEGKNHNGLDQTLKNGLEFYFKKIGDASNNGDTKLDQNNDLWIKDLGIATGNFIVVHGLEKSESILSIDENNFPQFAYIFKQYSRVMKEKIEDENENKIAFLDSAFSDLKFYFKKLNKCSSSVQNEYDVSDVSSLIYIVLNYVQQHNLNTNYEINIFELYYSFLPKLGRANNETKVITDSISNYLLIRTLNDGQLFYCEWIKNYVYDTVNIDLEPHYLILISLYLYYLENDNSIDKCAIKKIKKFSDNQWKDVIVDKCKIVSRCSSIFHITGLFKDLISYSENLRKTAYKNNLSFDSDKHRFDEYYISLWYVTAFFIGEGKLETENKFLNEIDIDLEKSQNKKLVKETIKKECIEINDNKEKFKINPVFKKYFLQFKISLRFSSDRSKSLENYLILYSKKRDITKTDSDSVPLTSSDLLKKTRKSISILKKSIAKIPILNKNLDLSGQDVPHNFSLTLSDSNCDEILDNLDFCKNQSAMFKRLVSWILRDLSMKKVPSRYISSSFISKIILSNSKDYFTERSKGRKKHVCLYIDDKKYSLDAITVNLELVEDSVLLKRLDEDETNKYLDEEFYGLNNGYRDLESGKKWASRNDVKKDLGAIWYQLSFNIKFMTEVNKDSLNDSE